MSKKMTNEELMEATLDITEQEEQGARESANKFAIRMIKAMAKLPEEDWEELPAEIQAWYNDAAIVLNEEDPAKVPNFPGTGDEEDEKPARGRRGGGRRGSSKDEEEEKPARGRRGGGRRGSSKDEEDEKPARGRRGSGRRGSSKDEEDEKPARGRRGGGRRGSSKDEGSGSDVPDGAERIEDVESLEVGDNAYFVMKRGTPVTGEIKKVLTKSYRVGDSNVNVRYPGIAEAYLLGEGAASGGGDVQLGEEIEIEDLQPDDAVVLVTKDGNRVGTVVDVTSRAVILDDGKDEQRISLRGIKAVHLQEEGEPEPAPEKPARGRRGSSKDKEEPKGTPTALAVCMSTMYENPKATIDDLYDAMEAAGLDVDAIEKDSDDQVVAFLDVWEALGKPAEPEKPARSGRRGRRS